MRFGTLSVMALAVCATLMANPAHADSTAPSAEPNHETGLTLRPARPLSLEPAPTSLGATWKLAVFVALAVGGLWLWRQRSRRPPQKAHAELRVLRRTTLGVRSEVVLLEVEGQKLLIGVTPSSMQTLYHLPDASDEHSAEERASASEKESRFMTLLDSRIHSRSEPRDLSSKPSPPDSGDDSPLEGQAASLRSIGTRR
jgi:flagellar protein FliO/FliZ